MFYNKNMAQHEIVERLLSNGFLVKPEILDKITEDSIESIISNTPHNTIVLKDITNNAPEFKIKNKREKNTLKPSDYVEYYAKKYSFLKDLLLKKTDPVSIDKSKNQPEATIIGMVSEITQKGCVIEDQTGGLDVKCNNSRVSINSVLAFTGKIKENIMEATSIIYPDVPLGTEVKEIKNKIILSDIKTDEEGYSVLSFDGIKTNPCFAKINGFSVFCYKPEKPIEKEKAISFLKNRFVPEDTPNEKFLIKEIPAFFWLDQKDEWEDNYKGVRIVSGERIKIN